MKLAPITLELDEADVRFADDLVARGEAASRSDAVHQALAAFRARSVRERVECALDRSHADVVAGRVVDAELVFDRLASKHRTTDRTGKG